MWQGTPMTFEGAAKATTVEGAEQTIARGVTAGVVSIKQLGTNGGGYFGPNSTHPYENPTPLSNFVETWSITIIPMSMVVMLGYMVGRRKLAVVIFATMLAIYLPMVVFGVAQEAGGNPAIARMGVDQSTGSMEGKEVRFGAALSALWAVTTTVTSNGSVNAMHDSLTPLGGLMPLIGMWLNNIFGGVGVGFINMLIFVIVAVFVAGMMIGRTPEFLGKKVEAKEMKLASLALLWHPLAILVGTAVACYLWATTADPATALAWLKNPGAARLLRDALRIHVGGREQRIRVRGPRRQHAVLEHLDRPGDAALTLHPDHRSAGTGRSAGGQTDGAGDGRFAQRRQRHVRNHAVGGHCHSRPADVHAGRGARTDCRASGPAIRSGTVMSREIKRAILFTLVTMVLLGGGYNVLLWAIGRTLFPAQAEGSLIRRADGTVVGSRLIAQKFTRPEYFQPRPSGVEYNAASTGGTNYGPSNPDHLKAVQERLDALTKQEGVQASQVPSEMVTASGAGMDPHIPPAAAELQARRVASARGVPIDRVRELLHTHTEPPTFGFLGRARVNVLELNLALDETFGANTPAGSK